MNDEGPGAADGLSTHSVRLLVICEASSDREAMASTLSSFAEVVQATSLQTGLDALTSVRVDLVVFRTPSKDSVDLAAVEDLYLARPGRPVLVLSDVPLAGHAEVLGRGAARIEPLAISSSELVGAVRGLLAGADRDALWAHHALHQQRVLRAVDGSVMLVSPSGRIIEQYDSADNLDGLPLEFLPHEEAMRTGKLARAELRLAGKDAGERWIEGTAMPLARPGEDQPYGVLHTYRDVSAMCNLTDPT